MSQQKEPGKVNSEQLAAMLGRTPRHVQEWARAGIAVKVEGKNLYDLGKSLLGIARHALDMSDRRKSASGDNEFQQSQIDLRRRQEQRIALEIAEREGQLCDAEDVRVTFASMARQLALWVDALPDNLERKVALSPVQIEEMRRQCDEQRMNIYDALHRGILKSPASNGGGRAAGRDSEPEAAAPIEGERVREKPSGKRTRRVRGDVEP